MNIVKMKKMMEDVLEIFRAAGETEFAELRGRERTAVYSTVIADSNVWEWDGDRHGAYRYAHLNDLFPGDKFSPYDRIAFVSFDDFANVHKMFFELHDDDAPKGKVLESYIYDIPTAIEYVLSKIALPSA